MLKVENVTTLRFMIMTQNDTPEIRDNISGKCYVCEHSSIIPFHFAQLLYLRTFIFSSLSYLRSEKTTDVQQIFILIFFSFRVVAIVAFHYYIHV